MIRKWDSARLCLRDVKRKELVLTYNRNDQSSDLKFAGGRKDPKDRDWIATAIREVYEETGIRVRRSRVRPLTWYRTSDGRRVIVGVVNLRPRKRLKPKSRLDDGECPGTVSYAGARRGKGIKKRHHKLLTKYQLAA